MKTVCLVLFALLAVAYTTTADEPRSSSTDLTKSGAPDTEGQIPVDIVYDEGAQPEAPKTQLNRQKRFLLTKLLLAKAALGAG